MICIYCGKQIDDGAVFCGYCGGKLGQSMEQMPEPVMGTSKTDRTHAVNTAKGNANVSRDVSHSASAIDSRKKRKIMIITGIIIVVVASVLVLLFVIKPWATQQH